ncbi:MAG: S41 family peptidase [Lautropia sp.]|nr:S41 family peptidase [Lautropia sp.]
MNATNLRVLAISALLATGLTACGGGGGGHREPLGEGASGQFAQQCAPDNKLARDNAGRLLKDYREGTRLTELSFVHAYLQENYLWYDEVPMLSPDLPAYRQVGYQEGMTNWFKAQLSSKLNPDGLRRDRFSFAMPTAEWTAQSRTGAPSTYGMDIGILRQEVPRDLRVVLVMPDTPAARQRVSRGDRLLSVVTPAGKRIDVVNTQDPADLDVLMQILFQARDGEEAQFEFDPAAEDGEQRRTVALSAGQYQAPPVQAAHVLSTATGGKVGYLMFNGFNLATEAQLIKAVTDMKAQNVSDVVVDLRYNGGGYLYQSAELAYMLSDSTLSRGKVFERLKYNDKRKKEESQLPFIAVASGNEGTETKANQALPSLGLRRVYVLTGINTCSASESLINGLRGIDVEVIQVGSTTCGKPYGFTAHDNCGMSYFPIEFNGVNDKGAGGFDAGFSPTCFVADDLQHQLGSAQEALLATALFHREHGRCPVAGEAQIKRAVDQVSGAASHAAGPMLMRTPAQTSSFLLP